MKETPLILQGWGVKATLDGLKTQTRRTYGLEKINESPNEWGKPRYDGDGIWLFPHEYGDIVEIKCPYGGPGDTLWIREAWAENERGQILYKADYESITRAMDFPLIPIKWKPSIFLPKEKARLWREIVSVRAERVQEISEEDAKAEGCQLIARTIRPFSLSPQPHFTEPERPFIYRDHFIGIWDSLNAKRGYGWDFNPWVWPIEYKQLPERSEGC